jgi:hypothetical protein
MDHGDDEDFVAADAVENSVRGEDDLAMAAVVFEDDATELRLGAPRLPRGQVIEHRDVAAAALGEGQYRHLPRTEPPRPDERVGIHPLDAEGRCDLAGTRLVADALHLGRHRLRYDDFRR